MKTVRIWHRRCCHNSSVNGLCDGQYNRVSEDLKDQQDRGCYFVKLLGIMDSEDHSALPSVSGDTRVKCSFLMEVAALTAARKWMMEEAAVDEDDVLTAPPAAPIIIEEARSWMSGTVERYSRWRSGAPPGAGGRLRSSHAVARTLGEPLLRYSGVPWAAAPSPVCPTGAPAGLQVNLRKQ